MQEYKVRSMAAREMVRRYESYDSEDSNDSNDSNDTPTGAQACKGR